MSRIILRFALTLLTLLMLAACGVPAQPVAQTNSAAGARPITDNIGNPKLGANSTLLTIRAEGGLCSNSSCWSEKQIKVDGSFTATDSSGVQKSGTLDAAAIAELTQQIAATDFEQINAQPFTGICPRATDGQEYIYTFQTMSGAQTLASCTVAIDETSPLFQTVTGLLKAMHQE